MELPLSAVVLAIFIAAFLTLCSQPALSSGGSYLIPNQILYDITSTYSDTASTISREATVREWLLKIEDFLQCRVSFVFSDRLATLLANRAYHLKRKVKTSTGGSGKRRFLQQIWEFKILESELSNTRPPLRVVQPLASAARQPRKRSAPYSKRQERRLRKQQIETCSSTISTVFSDKVAHSVILIDPQTKQFEQVSLSRVMDASGEVITQSEEQLIQMMLYVKDKYHVSGQACHEMTQLCKQMPRHYKIKQKIAELNSLWDISLTPDGILGVQQKLEDRLRLCFERMIDGAAQDTVLFPNNTVRVKLTGDGTNLGRHLHVVNFAFTILEEGSKAYGPSGNHCIAIIKEKDDYESLKKGQKDIVDDVKTLKSISVRGQSLDIVYYLGGDRKFLATVSGIGSTTSTYACIWCKCPALERHDCSQVWSISDTSKGARTIEEIKSLAQPRQRGEKYNVIEEPIFDMIPLVRVVVDNLHMFLRVADTLIDLLLIELRRLDCIEKATKIKSLDRLNNLKLYERTLKMLGISGFEFDIGRQSQKLKWRTLTGPEKLLLFSKINIPETFPMYPDAPKFSPCGRIFLPSTLLSAKPHQISRELLTTFETNSEQFLRTFVTIYPTKFVTPCTCTTWHIMCTSFSKHMEPFYSSRSRAWKI